MLNPFQAKHFSEEVVGDSTWELYTRVACRFGVLLAVLLVLPFPFGLLPGTRVVAEQYTAMWAGIASWIGAAGGAQAQLVVYPMFALIAAVVWSIVDRDDSGQRRLAYATSTLMRFWIAAALLDYGVVRCFATDPTTLAAGVAACSAGALLFWRRTATIGAMIAAGGIASVVVPSYQRGETIDVHTWEVLAGAAVLAMFELPRLSRALLGYATRARYRPYELSFGWNVVRWSAKAYLVGWIVYSYVDPQVTWLL